MSHYYRAETCLLLSFGSEGPQTRMIHHQEAALLLQEGELPQVWTDEDEESR